MAGFSLSSLAAIRALSLLSLASVSAYAQIQWRNPGVASPAVAGVNAAQLIDEAVAAGETHVVIQLSDVPSDELRKELSAAGIQLQGYLNKNGYFAVIDGSRFDRTAVSSLPASVQFQRLQPAWKLHPMLAAGELPQWAVVPPPDEADSQSIWIAAYVKFHADTPMNDGIAAALGHQALIISQLNTINGLVIEIPFDAIPAFASLDGVLYVEPALPPFKATNDSNRAITGANVVQAAPYNLTGAGVNVLVYDAGFALASHVDFQGRLSVRDSSGLSTHATHVAGTVGGAGIGNSNFKGMAPGVTIQSYGFEQVGGLHQGFLYTDPGDIEADYGSAINTHGAVIANNSIGTNTAPNGYPCSWEGDYGLTSAVIDSIVRGSLGGPIRIVWANGNERGSGRCGTTYHTTAPPACAKNHITVGALNSNDDSVTSFTSWGPTDDDRLKPDISAPGCQSNSDFGVTSCATSGNSSYTTFCGTSMASPTVCGLSALIMQDYRAQFPTRPDLRNATLKTLLAHNAQDIENPGPDYKSGYGSVRIQPTIDFMRTGQFVEETVSHNGNYRVTLVVQPGAPALKITLAWDDPPAEPVVVGTIINDLDIIATDPSGTQHFPWTLGGNANPAAPAVRTQADHINNIEQVFVANPVAGVWTVEIRGFNVPVGPQTFSACFTPAATGDCNGNGINDLEDIAAGTSLDCDQNAVPDECQPQDDCNGNTVLDFCDIFAGTSLDRNLNRVPDECDPDCNGNGTPDDWDIDTGLSLDCNNTALPDECDIAEGTSEDCDANDVPDECDPDCNANNIPDACDVASGTSPDCNENGIPDECDVAQGTAPDCNQNGIPDSCDIAAGTSQDCTSNGIPDECEEDCNQNGVADQCDIANGTSLDENLDGYPDECFRVYVNDNATGSNNGTNWLNAYTSLPLALGYAEQNLGVREIWIAAGTYRPPNSIAFTIRPGLALYGGFAGTETSIDQRDIAANPSVLAAATLGSAAHIITLSSPTPGVSLDGLTISRGFGSGAAIGGGVLVLTGTTTIRNCTISDNWSGSGAGAFVQGANATFVDCVFSTNTAQTGDGGAIGTSGSGSLTLNRCRFTGNLCRESGNGHGRGGAVLVAPGFTLNVNNCTFDGNTALNVARVQRAEGGGIANLSNNATVRNSIFIRNAASAGGGIYSAAPMTAINCVFTGNKAVKPNDLPQPSGEGGGLFGEAGVNLTLHDCTIAANWAQRKAAGVSMDGFFRNSVLWHNIVLVVPPDNPEPLVDQQYQGNVDVRYCDIAGLLDGGPPDPDFPGSIEANPNFVLAPIMTMPGVFTPGDLHLAAGSPCLDAGDNGVIPAGVTTDLDGGVRRFDDPLAPDVGLGTPPLVDMGAYERQIAPCPGDLNGDRVVDLADLAVLLAHFGTPSGATPADGDSDGDGDVDLQDLATLLARFGASCP